MTRNKCKVVTGVLLVWMSLSLCAQEPGAGELLRALEDDKRLEEPGPESSVLPALPESAPLPEGGAVITVQGFRLQGNQEFEDDTLLALLGDVPSELTLAQLYEGAARITHFYRSRGYWLSEAYLPAQQVGEDGVITIGVQEGRYGKITLDNRSRIGGAVPEAMVSGLESGDVITLKPLERRLLLLKDLPGAEAQSSVSAGAEPGEADLSIILSDGPRVSGSVALDNYGNRHTGEYRLSTQLNVASPLGFGDELTVNLLVSNEEQWYYQARYGVPVNGLGTRAGLAVSKMDYQLAGDFKVLQATGTADTIALFVSHPWVRSRNFNLASTLQVERKALEDGMKVLQVSTDKTANNVALAVSGDWRDSWGGGGANGFRLGLVQGHLSGDASERGNFGKWQFSVLRLQRLSERWSLYGALQGQLTDGNLDASEKFSLGGAYGVRGYPVGEASADEAVMGSVELRYRWRPEWQFKVMGESGYARLERHPVSSGGHRSLSSYGVGADWQPRSDVSVTLAVAQRSGELPSSDRDRSPRAWAQMSWRF